jgi:hypothetical protein
MQLRGHHLLCLLGFDGHGYSPKFIAKMHDLSALYRSQADMLIEITADTDEVCAACPYVDGPDCGIHPITDRLLRKMDQRILTHLGLVPGKKYAKHDILQRIAERMRPEDIHFLCSGCVWKKYGVCEAAIANLTVSA